MNRLTRRLAAGALMAAVALVAAAFAGAGSSGDGWGGWSGGSWGGSSGGYDRGGGDMLVGSNNNGGTPTVVVFSSGNPSDVKRLQVIGLTPGDRVLGLDVRPATGTLYGQGYNSSTSQNYVVQLNFDVKPAGFDGQASFSPIGARYNSTGAFFGYDFNPTVDRIRVISDANDNKRINPDNGAALQDGLIKYAAGDRNAGRDANAVGAGYLPAPFGGTTTLYDIEANQDVLVTQNPPNDGTLNTIGSLGVNTTDVVGFDIRKGGSDGGSYSGSSSGSGDYTAYAALQRQGSTSSGLYRIDLRSGKASFVGTIGGPAPLASLAILNY